MATVVKERLDNAMQKENIDIKSFNYATREGMYNTLINGPVINQDIEDAANLLGCNTDYLVGGNMVIDGVTRKINTVCIIGSIIKERLKDMHWTYRTFAAYTGIATGSIGNYCIKDNYVSLETAEAIAYGLNCSVEYLQGKTKDSTRYVKYGLSEHYRKKRMMQSINASNARAFISCSNLTYDDLSKMINFPAGLIKTAINSQNAFIPKPSAEKLDKIMNEYMANKEITSAKRSGRFNKSSGPNVPVEEHKLLKEKEYADKISTALTRPYFEQKAQEKIDAEARKEQVKKYFGGMVMKEVKEAAKVTTQEIPSGSIS